MVAIFTRWPDLDRHVIGGLASRDSEVTPDERLDEQKIVSEEHAGVAADRR
jgi:hypothetical protein